MNRVRIVALCAALCLLQPADAAESLTGTQPLTAEGDLSAQMVAGIHRYLDQAAADSTAKRPQFWNRDCSSKEAYLRSIEPNRRRFRVIIGAVDPRITPARVEYVAGPDLPAMIAETDDYRVFAIRWTVYDDVQGEGLLLTPKAEASARIVALPDADQTPEMLAGLQKGMPPAAQFARRLAAAGCEVVVPVLINRQCTWSGNPQVVMTDQTHREWVWRQGVEMGRHVIGYEVQKVEAAIDWLASRNQEGSQAPIGVAGYGEGALIALYTAAVDQRIQAALVSGYFDSRLQLWSEPIYRSVFGLLREFGDAEIASLIAPRTLVVEHSEGPRVDGPPTGSENRRQTAAPGKLVPPEFASVKREVERARRLCSPLTSEPSGLIDLAADSDGGAVGPGSDRALQLFLSRLGVKTAGFGQNDQSPNDARRQFDPDQRQRSQVAQLVEHSQSLLRRAERIRADFWKKAPVESAQSWPQAARAYKDYLWSEVLGKLPDPSSPPRVRSRKILDRSTWSGYEVAADIWPDVFAWGYLLIPKGIRADERRPVVVCQHGLEGLPESVVTEDPSSRGYRAYRAYAVRLVERGFVVYAPHNPYRGETDFRQLQRKANPLKLTIFSFILGQHQWTLDWLSQLPFVDENRIGFYGLSYGGVSALRIPSLLDRYALSICSAAFNDWPRKIMSLDFRASYMFTREYDHFTFGLGGTFSNAELAALIAPRPFMVERGHGDGVAPDEWVAYEYAKVRRLYAQLGVPERTQIEFFDGGHVINGQGTFDFLHRHLRWPEASPAEPAGRGARGRDQSGRGQRVRG